jgi:hypothetical protein
VSVGDAIFDIGSNNCTIASLTFVNTAGSSVSGWTPGPGPDGLAGGYYNGVIGTGLLHITGDINVLGTNQNTAADNTIQTNFNLGTATQVCRLAGPTTGLELIFSGPISGSGNLVDVAGLQDSGLPQTGTSISTAGGMSLVANNTYTGSTLFATGTNLIAGTNATTTVTIANAATLELLAANGSLGGAATITISNGGNLSILNSSAYGVSSGGSSNPYSPAANNNDRISDTAAVVLRDGTFNYQSSNTSNSSEIYGTLNASAGANTLTITGYSTGLATLTAGKLFVGPTATLSISSPLGAASNQQLFTTAPYTDSTGILPRVVMFGSSSSVDFVTYNSASGLIALPANSYSNNVFAAGTNVYSNSSSAVSVTSISGQTLPINALKLSGGGTLNLVSGSTLSISSGMILCNSGSSRIQVATGSAANSATLDFGTTNPGAIILGSGSTGFNEYCAVTGTNGLVISSASTGAVALAGDLHGLSGALTINSGSVFLEEGQSGNIYLPGPINVRTGILRFVSLSGLPVVESNSPGSLGAITLGEPENASNVTPVSISTPAQLNLAGAPTGSVLTRNLIVSNGGLTNYGNTLYAGYYSTFPELNVNSLTSVQTIAGNVTLNSPLYVYGGGSPSGSSTGSFNFNGSISGAGTLALGNGLFNLNGILTGSGPIWVGPAASGSYETAYVNFNGSGSLSTSPVIGFGGGGLSTLSYASAAALPNAPITIQNANSTGASNGINDFTIKPLATSSISNTININSDTTFKAPSGVVGTWAGQLNGSSALYVAGGTLVIPTGGGSTFSGPVYVNGPGAVLNLAAAALTPSVINVVNGTLAMRGITSVPINVSGGTLYPGYGLSAGTSTSLTLPATTILGSSATTELDLTELSGTTGVSDQLIFTGSSGPALAGNLNVSNTGAITFTAGDNFHLFNFSSGPPSGSFSLPLNLPTLPAGLAWNTGNLFTTGTLAVKATAIGNDVWTSSSSGSWETNGNWSLGTAPGGNGSVETFGNAIGSGSATVTLNVPETAGNLTFNNSQGGSYTIAGAGLSMYSSTSGPASINVSSGAQTINSNVDYASQGLSINTGSGSLTFGGAVGGPGPLSVAGNVSIAGALNASGTVTTAQSATINFTGSGSSSPASLTLGTTSTLNLMNGTLNPSLFTSSLAGTVNISNGAIFASNSTAQSSFSVTGGAVNVSGAMNLGTYYTGTAPYNIPNDLTGSVNLTNVALTINNNGSFSAFAPVALSAGAKLFVNGGFSDGLYTASSTSTLTLTAGANTSVYVAPGASWNGGLLLKIGSVATFGGASSGSSIDDLFINSLQTNAGSSLNPGLITSAGLFALGSSSSSYNRTFLVIGPGGASFSGQIDVGDGDMTSLSTYTGSSGLKTLFNQIRLGYNNGAWNGANLSSGVIFSSTAAADPTHLHALGIALNDAGLNTTGVATGILYPNFDNWQSASYNAANPLSDNDVLIKYTYYGDANLDGTVDGSDYTLIDNGYLNHLTGWYNGDFNYDGVINGSDYALMDNAFNTQGASITSIVASPTALVAAENSEVPEPTAIGSILAGTVALLGRRARHALTRRLTIV